MGNDWYYSIDGTVTSGPISERAIRDLLRSGQLPPDGHVRHAGWDVWAGASATAAYLGWSQEDEAHAAIAEAGPPASSAAETARSGIGVLSDDTTSPGLRMMSWFIDVAVLTSFGIISGQALPAAWSLIVSFSGFVGYVVVLPALGYETLGHTLIGLRVEHLDDTPTWTRYFVRGTVQVLLAAPLLIGWVLSAMSMMSDAESRAWHDLASGSRIRRVRPFTFVRHRPGPVSQQDGEAHPTARG